MSISEFFVDHGLNSGEDFNDWMDNYGYGQDCDGQQGYYVRRPYEPPVFGLDVSKLKNSTKASEPLDESKLDHFAKAGGWYKLGTRKSEAPMASYYGNGMKLDFGLSTGTVGSYRDSRSGPRTEVFRCVIDGIHQAQAIFQNPHSPPTADEPRVQISGLEVVVKQEKETLSMGSKDQDETPKIFLLDESGLDGMATTHDWNKISTDTSQAAMASYSRQDMRLNFWLSTGTVGSYLDHPQQGKTQLFRREVDMQQANEIFQNPRVHTGAGYQRREHAQKRKSHQKEPKGKRARR
jgi:hypothetical protein